MFKPDGKGTPANIEEVLDCLMSLYVSGPHPRGCFKNAQYTRATKEAYDILDSWGMIGE